MNTTPSAGSEVLQLFVHHVVLALALGEVDPRNAVVAGEAAYRGAERIGDARQRRGRGYRQSQLPMDVADQPRRVLQLWNINVQIHAVDAVDLEPHMFGQDIADRSRYGHHGLRSFGRPVRPTNRTRGSYTGSAPLVTGGLGAPAGRGETVTGGA
jgi:hypothetical protein